MTGIFRQGNKFYQDLSVPCYAVDRDRRLRPGSFMDLAQEIAHWAAEMLGAGFDALAGKGTAWVLSRMHIHFAETPLWQQDVRLWTWHKGFDSLFFLRDFLLEDTAGKSLVTATSSWLIIDTASRRLIRNPGEIKLLDLSTADPTHAIAEPSPKIQLPAGGPELVGSRKVAYSDIDFLGHANNARYMVWAMDCLDEDALHPKDVFINFNKEILPGDRVDFARFRETAADGTVSYYIEGLVDGRQAFAVKFA